MVTTQWRQSCECQRDKTITQNVLWNAIFMNVFSQSDGEGSEWKWLMSSLLSRTRWRTILCSSCQMSWRSTWRTGRRSLFASTAAPLSRYGNACDSQSKLKLAASAASLITKGEIHFSQRTHSPWNSIACLTSIRLSTSFIQARLRGAPFQFWAWTIVQLSSHVAPGVWHT